jgi:hypothetical protein
MAQALNDKFTEFCNVKKHMAVIFVCLALAVFSGAVTTFGQQGLQADKIILSTDARDATFEITRTLLLRKPEKSVLKQNPESVLLLKSPCLEVQPFFCRIESRIEQKSGIALRFRLGSLDYTNYLEGKGADER